MRTLVVLFFALSAFVGCQSTTSTPATTQTSTATNLQKIQFRGETMGTTYAVTYLAEANTSFKPQMDALLVAINDEVSTYIPSATISQFNTSEQGVDLSGKAHFLANLKASRQIYTQTKGAFDPTIMPLVNYWGFGYTLKRAVDKVDSQAVKTLVSLVGMDNIDLTANQYLAKAQPGTQLDFSAIAKGYAVDEMGRLLEAKNIENYLVEIGGEARARGKNDRGEYWVIGVSKPDPNAQNNEFSATISLENQGVATSGNYRNYYRTDRGDYGHTINSKTGYPEKNGLLSATVLASDCMTADAFATACMEMGLPDAQAMIDTLDGVEAYFIFAADSNQIGEVYTQGAKRLISSQ